MGSSGVGSSGVSSFRAPRLRDMAESAPADARKMRVDFVRISPAAFRLRHAEERLRLASKPGFVLRRTAITAVDPRRRTPPGLATRYFRLAGESRTLLKRRSLGAATLNVREMDIQIAPCAADSEFGQVLGIHSVDYRGQDGKRYRPS